MPEAGEVAPVVSGLGLRGVRDKHLGRELGGPEGDFVEVAVVGLQALAFFAVTALALFCRFPEGGEERFPFRRVFRKIRVSMGVGRKGHANEKSGSGGGWAAALALGPIHCRPFSIG